MGTRSGRWPTPTRVLPHHMKQFGSKITTGSDGPGENEEKRRGTKTRRKKEEREEVFRAQTEWTVRLVNCRQLHVEKRE